MNQFQKGLITILILLTLAISALAFIFFGAYKGLQSISVTYKATLDSTTQWRKADAAIAHPQTRVEAAKWALDKAKREIDSLVSIDTTRIDQHWDAFRTYLGTADSLVGTELLGEPDTSNHHW
jgi:type IV secretory pathway TrbF-like protein